MRYLADAMFNLAESVAGILAAGQAVVERTHLQIAGRCCTIFVILLRWRS